MVNAATAQLLRLPPELRCHIYDHVFGNNSVLINLYHDIEQRFSRISYRPSMCTCEHGYTQLSARLHAYNHEEDPESACMESCQISSAAQRSSACESLSLPLLQVCRQIYFEAALKPFQRTLFIFDLGKFRLYQGSYGLPIFMDTLLPAQVKAITHLRILSDGFFNMEHAKLWRLQRLKHLKLRLNFRFADFDHILPRLQDLKDDPIVESLVRLKLKSIHVELGLDGPSFRDRIRAELSDKIIELTTADDANLFEEALKRTEAKLLGPSLRGSAS